MVQPVDRLSPINKVGLTGQVVDRIKDYIKGEELAPGTRLPSERELAQRLGVSRGITREALRALQAVGVLEIRVGDGTFVADVEYGALFRHVVDKAPLSVEDNRCLLEARIGFECAALDLAGRRATDDDLRRMEASLARMAEATSLGEKVQADMDFHSWLLRSAHNPIVTEMCGFLRWYFVKGIPTIGGVELNDELSPELVAKDLVEHRAIMDALRNRRIDEGRRVLSQHLLSAIERNVGRKTLCEAGVRDPII